MITHRVVLIIFGQSARLEQLSHAPHWPSRSAAFVFYYFKKLVHISNWAFFWVHYILKRMHIMLSFNFVTNYISCRYKIGYNFFRGMQWHSFLGKKFPGVLAYQPATNQYGKQFYTLLWLAAASQNILPIHSFLILQVQINMRSLLSV